MKKFTVLDLLDLDLKDHNALYLKCIGGSDAHYLNHKWFINCATQFEDTFQSEAELIEALNYGQYRSIELPSAKA